MASLARYLADTSAIARFRSPAVSARLRPMLEDGDIATCAIVDLEVLYSARNAAHYEAIREERGALESAPITPAVVDRALDVQHSLARSGHHRLPVQDLVIAAAAEAADLSVLHYDSDFGRIASVTGQPHEWVVPRGSL